MKHFILVATLPFLLAFTLATPAFSQNRGGTIVALQAGSTTVSGDLADSQNPMWGLIVLGMFPHHEPSSDWSRGVDDALGGLRSGLFFNISTTQGIETKKDTKFPYPGEKKLNMLSDTLGFDICALARTPVNICISLGYETLEITKSSPKYRQTYGAVPWGLVVQYMHSSGLYAGAAVNTRDINQAIDDEESKTTILNANGMIGWTF